MSDQTIKSSGNGVVKQQSKFTVATHIENAERDEIELVIEQGVAKQITSLADIEKGLTMLWQAAAKPKQGDDPDQQAVMRACVFNLIILVEGEQQLEEVTQVIAQITYAYPCRAIVLVQKPDLSLDDLTAYISAHCSLPQGSGRKVCCEQITIIGSKDADDALYSMVLPLLVSELPVILWCPSEPNMYSELFRQTIETADRLIVDSRTFRNPSETFNQLAELLYSEYHNTAFSDLSWGRLTPWRSMLAYLFDSAEFQPYLQFVEKLEIQYEAPDDNSNPNFSEALLFVGWLANQLHWKPAFKMQQRGMNGTLYLNQDGSPLLVHFFGHNDRVDDLGGMTQMKLFSYKPGDGNEVSQAVFTIGLTEDYERVVATVEENGEIVKSRSALFPKRPNTELLCEDFTVIGHDDVFEHSLGLAGQFNSP
jgi:glucose-6-phosphate dehydrogenase assembly protein OpcA